jgi:hypothetical protein
VAALTSAAGPYDETREFISIVPVNVAIGGPAYGMDTSGELVVEVVFGVVATGYRG